MSALPTSQGVLSPALWDALCEHGDDERGLALLSLRAFEALYRQGPAPRDVVTAAREALEGLRFSLAGGRFDLFSPSVRAGLPPRVIEAWRLFTGLVQAPGRGQVRVFDLPVGLDSPYVVYADLGEVGVLEVYDASGALLLSGCTRDDRLVAWNDDFGVGRAQLRATGS
jgi:hypothetical protein